MTAWEPNYEDEWDDELEYYNSEPGESELAAEEWEEAMES